MSSTFLLWNSDPLGSRDDLPGELALCLARLRLRPTSLVMMRRSMTADSEPVRLPIRVRHIWFGHAERDRHRLASRESGTGPSRQPPPWVPPRPIPPEERQALPYCSTGGKGVVCALGET